MKRLFTVLALVSALSFSSNAHALTGLGMSDTTVIAGGQSLSAIFGIGEHQIQTILGVHQTKGNFDFAVGGFFRMPLIGTAKTGFHFGPGFTIGTFGGDFAFTVVAAFGAHFTIFENMMLSVDGGPMYVHTQAAKNFKLKPIGDTLGLSIHYMFN